MFFEVLDFDKPMYDHNKSKMDAPPELCMHIFPVEEINVLAKINVLAITDKGNALQNTFDVITTFRVVAIKHSCEEFVNRMINHLSQEFDAFRKKKGIWCLSINIWVKLMKRRKIYYSVMYVGKWRQ
ncbi:hypothetical protein KFK09_006372 [Dendrobium nobile]|uniref:Uncharacterized protein n=1 Tax=Dendrobium nobile TaxID=94219 RepID=A0A8T3BNX0_DENNO|nr:hypothetical protein KFK09_006372 [Dendrobium nobile]